MTQTAIPDLPPLPLKMTFEEYLNWPYEHRHVEWVDGEIILISPIEDIHIFLAKWLIKVLDEFVIAHDLGLLLSAPFTMRLAKRPSGREPDVFFVAKENLSRMTSTYLDGPADLAIEIVSPESEHRDRVVKLDEYEKGGVREYWVLSPRNKEALFYQLGEDGKYRLVTVDESGIYRSAVLTDLWLKVEWLWQEPLPPLLTTLKEWGLLETK